MKSIRAAILMLLWAAGLCGGCFAAAAEEEPSVSAASAVLMDADTGEILYARNEDDRRLIASTTKIMTALVVIERCDLDTAVVIEPAWTGIEGSSMYLVPGQELTVRDLLYGLMLASGNDAAVALACVTAGSVESFAALMNEKAAELGCMNTHFENPNGLNSEAHYSSARDLAILTRAAIASDEFRQIVSSTAKTVGGQTYRNHNRLLTECEGVFGVKTGYTEAAGRALVSACERNGLTLICVTLSDPDDWNDHKTLYDWAYSRWVRQPVLTEEDRWTVPVIGGEKETAEIAPEASCFVTRSAGDSVAYQLRIPSFVYADTVAGEPAGEAVVCKNGETVGTVTLVFTENIERTPTEKPSFRSRLRALFGFAEGKVYTLS